MSVLAVDRGTTGVLLSRDLLGVFEIPGRTLDPGETHFEETAYQILADQTGYQAAPGSLHPLGMETSTDGRSTIYSY